MTPKTPAQHPVELTPDLLSREEIVEAVRMRGARIIEAALRTRPVTETGGRPDLGALDARDALVEFFERLATEHPVERCPDCEGDGQVVVNSFQAGDQTAVEWGRCPTCKGTGQKPFARPLTQRDEASAKGPETTEEGS